MWSTTARGGWWVDGPSVACVRLCAQEGCKFCSSKTGVVKSQCYGNMEADTLARYFLVTDNQEEFHCDEPATFGPNGTARFD